MTVCVYIYMCVYMFICLFIYLSIYSLIYLIIYLFLYIYILYTYNQLCAAYNYIAKYIVFIHLEWTTHENTVLLWSPVSFGRTPQDPLLPQQPIARKALESRRPKCIKRVFPLRSRHWQQQTTPVRRKFQVAPSITFCILQCQAGPSWPFPCPEGVWRNHPESPWRCLGRVRLNQFAMWSCWLRSAVLNWFLWGLTFLHMSWKQV